MSTMALKRWRQALAAMAGCAWIASAANPRESGEHGDFLAELEVHYGQQDATLHLSTEPAQAAQQVRWQIELLSPQGHTLRRWRGTATLGNAPVDLPISWDAGITAPPRPELPGTYQLRLQASAGGHSVSQRWDVAASSPQGMAQASQASAAATSAHHALATPPHGPTASSYVIRYGNLHSQTNHSDGGGALGHCTGAQDPQSAALGPADAYEYARQHGLDFLMTSEHNHMYDGSDGTNLNADPSAAHALYQGGLHAADDYTAAHPDFLAVYGQEWGVISHGGHLNIFNSPELLGWEHNAGGQLLADTFSARSDYASLYQLMRARGWIGQFNHPAEDQFAVNGQPLAYTPDGDAVMVLCEVMNSNAFSQSADETERRHSNFEAACNKLLAAGYHLAFSSDQDNHCANWGASYSNRTGVLLAPDAPLTRDALLDALRARRVFATMDKTAYVIFSGNGHLMGERFHNHGLLTLQVDYASRSGHHLDAITILHAIPGAGGEFVPVSHATTSELQPSTGEHVYYARLVQDDGKLLWSAPLWITQEP
jgi:hypothetical protein